MPWKELTDVTQLDPIGSTASERPQLIFKHSTRCSISDIAWKRLHSTSASLEAACDLHFLDLIRYRDVSNAIAERFGVLHESPQTLLIRAGEVLLDQSHLGVDPAEVLEVLAHSQSARP